MNLTSLADQMYAEEASRPKPVGLPVFEELLNRGLTQSQAQYALSQLQGVTDPAVAAKRKDELIQEFGGLKDVAVAPEDFLALGLSTPIKALMTKGASKLASLGAQKSAAELAKIGALQQEMAVGNAAFDIGAGALRTVVPEQWQQEHPIGMLGGELLAGGMTAALPNKLAASARSGVLRNMMDATPDFLASEVGAANVSVPLISQKVSSAWDEAIGQNLTSLARKLGAVSVVPKEGRIARKLGGSTLREMFTSPLDRAPAEAGALINDTMIESARASEALKTASSKIVELPLEARDELRKVLRGGLDINKASGEYQGMIADILAPFDEALGHAKSKLLGTGQKEQLYNNEMQRRLLQLFSEDADDPIMGMLRMQTTHDLTTSKGTQKFLKEIIDSPLVPQATKNLAIDLHDLPSRTMTDVARSYKGSLESIMFSDIVSNPDWVKHPSDFAKQLASQYGNDLNKILNLSKAEKGVLEREMDQFVKVPNHPVFGDLLVHRDIAEGIRDLDNTQTAARNLWNTYFLNPWKLSKVIMNPAARVRDLFSNAMFADIAGKHSLSMYNLKPYIQALKEAKANGPLRKEFEHWTGSTLGNWADIAAPAITRAAKHNAGVPELFLSALYNNRLSSAMTNLAQFSDQWVKLAKFIHNKEMGMEAKEAALDAVKAIGDYNRQTRTIKLVRDTAMPFFGWQAHAIKQVAGGFAHRPLKTMKYFALPVMASMAALDSLNINEDDWQQIKEALPEYLKDSVMGVPTHIPIPFRDEKGRIQMFDASYWLPGLQDMAEMGRTAGNITNVLQNPAISLYAALKDNKKFSGAPIWYEWEDPSTKAAKAFSYIGQQMLPSWTPGIGTAYDKIARSFDEGDEQAPTTTQALGSLAGLRVTPVDEGQIVANKQKLLKAYEAEAKAQMKRELQRTGSESKQEKIVEKYQAIFERLYTEMGSTGED